MRPLLKWREQGGEGHLRSEEKPSWGSGFQESAGFKQRKGGERHSCKREEGEKSENNEMTSLSETEAACPNANGVKT